MQIQAECRGKYALCKTATVRLSGEDVVLPAQEAKRLEDAKKHLFKQLRGFRDKQFRKHIEHEQLSVQQGWPNGAT